MDFGLRQKVAIVCAASKGLGRACATMLAREGANVVVCARNEQALNEAVQSIRTESGAQVLPVVCDLTRGEDIERLMEKSVEEFGTVHILVTNVGHPQMGAFSDLNEVDWQHGYEGVLLPVIRLCRLVIPHMRKAEWGRIVHITSVAVREPGTPYLISSVFRAGVAALSKSLANAGHHAHPLLVRNGTVQQLVSKGMPLGMMAGIAYREIEYQLQSGDVIVFMTDGIIEAKDSSGTEYQDTDRLQQILTQFTPDIPAEAMVDTLIDDAITFGADMTTEEEDDITVVVVKVL